MLSILACATLLAANDDTTTLKDRARQLWEARVQDRWDVVFDLMPPEEQAAAKEREGFAAYQKEKGPFLYLSAEVADAVVDGDTGWVRVKFVVRPRLYPIAPSTVEKWDVWLKREDWRPIPREAANQFPSKPPMARDVEEDQVLAKRVEGFWRALETADLKAAYDYMDPGYRAENSLEVHLARPAKYLYLSHKVQWVETDSAEGKAKITFMQKLDDPTLPKLEPEEKTTVEQWIKADGQWFRNSKPTKGGS